jgi:hypothetical protein
MLPHEVIKRPRGDGVLISGGDNRCVLALREGPVSDEQRRKMAGGGGGVVVEFTIW